MPPRDEEYMQTKGSLVTGSIKRPTVIDSLQECSRCVIRLMDEIKELEGRLNPILDYPNPETDSIAEENFKNPEVKIDSMVGQLATQIRRAENKVAGLKERVQL